MEKGKKILKKALFWTAVAVLPGGSLLVVYAAGKKYKLDVVLKAQFNKLRRNFERNNF